ncbi:VWA domain-containing protein [Photobacterium galatheae]|uniref:Magnesium chelatase n=1 Tax=Photobacterium galatheae TaxID=1654360 RepID=A0A066RRL2_9GAMM|nr:VWA domain-containing protein [Photobacterium galatheae]KDM90317.1 magnesium chelatase [Photobacterium galatheae]MCM0150802.1 VWA domain-containing protein [Photobacterium galatheae]
MNTHDELSRRWRLILGSAHPHALSGEDTARDECLDTLYAHEYQGRGGGQQGNGLQGGTVSGMPRPVTWLNQVRKAFPVPAAEILQKEGIERYGLQELLLDKEILAAMKPNIGLLQTILAFRAQIPASLEKEIEAIVAQVCAELEEVLAQPVQSPFARQRTPFRSSRKMPVALTDWRSSLMRNLKHYQPDEQALLPERMFFYQSQVSQVCWDIHLVVDQSGSMLNNLIHATVVAAIFCRLSVLKVRLVLFDTRVVDMSEFIDDPVRNLLSVQLGGGTDIGKAMQYTREQITQPHRSIVVLISDFYEGGSPTNLYHQVAKMQEAGVTLLGLTAMDSNGAASYDHHIIDRLLKMDMPIASMTPENLSQWVADVIR